MKKENPKSKSTALFLLLTTMVIAILLFSCKTRTTNENQTGHDALPEEKNQVEVVVVQREDFTREIISNGKLAAIQKAELVFENPGIVESINYRNGQTAPKGC